MLKQLFSRFQKINSFFEIPVQSESVRQAPESVQYNNLVEVTDDDFWFNQNHMLAELLLKEIVFINDFWWMDGDFDEEWPQSARNKISINLNLNDIFYSASADAVNIDYDELQELYQYYKTDDTWGPIVFGIKKRKRMPSQAIYNTIQQTNRWNLDLFDLQPNPFWH